MPATSLFASSPPPPSPTPPPPPSPDSMPIYLSHSNMPPIHMLPVELLTRIFQLGVDSDPLPDDRDNSQLTFEVSVSHVCRHWRHIALHTPHLWTLIHFRTKSHMSRGRVYLTRNARLPIDIYVDTCSEDTHRTRKDLLFRDEFLPVFDVVLPHIDRWRELHLKVADLDCKGFARKVLNTCGPAPLLRTLQLWHVQNWRTPERLFGAIGPPPVVVFAGVLPSLKHIILQGVNLPWTSSPFLSNLSSIEYALHSDDVRMPWDLWRAMLASSPALTRLTLHYSGPRARSSGVGPPDGIEWWGAEPPGPDHALLPGAPLPPAADPVLLPCLQEIRLHDLDSDYLVALFRTLEAPALRTLHLELDTEDQDFTPFVQYLTAPPPAHRRLASAPSPHLSPHSRTENSHATTNGVRGSPSGDRGGSPSSAPAPGAALGPAPKFPQLECLSVAALACGVESWRALLRSARGLTRLVADFAVLPEGTFDVLLEDEEVVEREAETRGEEDGARCVTHGANGVNGRRTNGMNGTACNGNANGNGKGKARATHPDSSDSESDSPTACTSTSTSISHTNPNPHSSSHSSSSQSCSTHTKPRPPPLPLLPHLTSLRLAGVSGKQLAALAAHRRARGRPVRRWEVEEGARDEDGLRVAREMADASARWRVAEEARMRAGRARMQCLCEGAREGALREGEGGDGEGESKWEPWRLDEPIEALEWFREEVADEDDEDEEDEDEEDEEEEYVDGGEDEDEDEDAEVEAEA